MRALGPSLAAAGVSTPQLLPCYGVGHSVGGLLHLLISARYAVQVGRGWGTGGGGVTGYVWNARNRPGPLAWTARLRGGKRAAMW